MSRHHGIPRCRRWRVRYHFRSGEVHEVIVYAVNTRFARWNAREAAGYRLIVQPGFERETVSVVRES